MFLDQLHKNKKLALNMSHQLTCSLIISFNIFSLSFYLTLANGFCSLPHLNSHHLAPPCPLSPSVALTGTTLT